MEGVEERFASGRIAPGDQHDLNVVYVTDAGGLDEVCAAIAAVEHAAIDIETAPDQEGMHRLKADAQMVPVAPHWTPFEEYVIGGEVNPPGDMPRGELEELRAQQQRTLLENAVQMAAEIDARLGSLDLTAEQREQLLGEREQLEPLCQEFAENVVKRGPTTGQLPRRIGRRPLYGLEPNEAVTRLIQIGIDDPHLGRVQYVVDCFAVDPRPLIEAIREHDPILLVYNAEFERKHLGYRFGIDMRMIDLYEGTRAIQDALRAQGKEMPSGGGLAAMHKYVTGEEMSKEQQVSNWKAKALSEEQITYAAIDVRVLHPLLLSFIQILDELGAIAPKMGAARADERVAWRIRKALRVEPDEVGDVMHWIAKAQTAGEVEAVERWARSRRLTHHNLPVVDRAVAARRQDLGIEQDSAALIPAADGALDL